MLFESSKFLTMELKITAVSWFLRKFWKWNSKWLQIEKAILSYPGFHQIFFENETQNDFKLKKEFSVLFLDFTKFLKMKFKMTANWKRNSQFIFTKFWKLNSVWLQLVNENSHPFSNFWKLWKSTANAALERKIPSFFSFFWISQNVRNGFHWNSQRVFWNFLRLFL